MIMAQIDYIIGESNLEKVRTKIAEILADELANQKSLIEALTEPTDEQILTLNSIPDKVYEERFVRISESEYTILNVTIMNQPMSALTGFQQQTDVARINIEAYSQANASSEQGGDTAATLKLHRLIMLCRHIIMAPEYYTLGFEKGIIGSRVASDIEIYQPDEGMDNGYVISGKFTMQVKIIERNNSMQGVELQESATTHRLNDSDKGYYYEIINN